MNQTKLIPKRKSKNLIYIFNSVVIISYFGYYYHLVNRLHSNPIDKVFFSASNLEILSQSYDIGIYIGVASLLLNFITFKWLFHLRRSFLKAAVIFMLHVVIMIGLAIYIINTGNTMVETL